MNTIDNKCPTCGAPLIYNINTKNWICNYCKKEYYLNDLQSNIDKFNKMDVSPLDIYECNNCGAKAITNSSTSATKCIYCGSSIIIKKKLVGEYKPDFIIPFKNNEEQIMNIFSKNLKKKFLSDNAFKDIKNVTNISKLYVPYWLVSCDVMASIKGILYAQSDDYTVNKQCRRLGNMRFERIPADAKSNLPDELLQSIEPIDYSQLIPFEYPYLSGFFAEAFDQNQDEIKKNQIKARIEEAAATQLIKTVCSNPNNFSLYEKNVFSHKYKFEYVLVPVWFVNMEYEGKKYNFCINDQTGKVGGKRHVNKLKVLLVYLAYTLLIALLGIYMNLFGLEETSLYFLIISISLGYSAIGIKVASYTKLKKGKNSFDYIVKNSFVLMDSTTTDSF